MTTAQDRFATLPTSLRQNARLEKLGAGVPALICLPEEHEPPVGALVWMHGRTAFKELDNGRYLRLMRAGIASIALDLPGHGERYEAGRDHHSVTPGVIAQMLEELPGVIDDLREREPRIDPNRLLLGGMSAGGMVAARACYGSDRFRGLIMESSSGWLRKLYDSEIETPDGHLGRIAHTGEAASLVESIDTMHQLGEEPGAWPTIPVLALHSETDRTVPISCQQGFMNRLREIYAERGADTEQVRLHTWPETGAPYEHAGFGKVASEAKGLVVEFVLQHIP